MSIYFRYFQLLTLRMLEEKKLSLWPQLLVVRFGHWAVRGDDKHLNW